MKVWVGSGDDRHGVFALKHVERDKKPTQARRIIHILRPMQSHKEEFLRYEVEPLQRLRLVNLPRVMLDNFPDRVPRNEYPLPRNSLSQEILPAPFGIRKMDRGTVVDQAAVYFFGRAGIVASIASLHVVDRNAGARADDGSQR